ncbi:MAG: LysE family translocator [Sphingomonadales bacterium]|nr:LysE family translocator [Sphingomonadales bacterium]
MLGALAAIYVVHLAAAISPGPAILMAARTGMTEGFARSLWLSVGIGLGATVWAAAALFGLSVLFAMAPAALVALKLAGAAYLIWIALQIWRHAPDPVPVPDGATPRGRGALLWRGLATQLANPKPAVFFGTVFLTFVPPEAPAWVFPVILGIVFVNDAGCAMLIARLFSLEPARRRYLGLKTLFERSFGALLAGLGVKLALT